MFILSDGYPLKIYISKRGNLVGDFNRMAVFGTAENRDSWPKRYKTEQEVRDVQAGKENRCNHQWVTISHEERKCDFCKTIEFVPDF